MVIAGSGSRGVRGVASGEKVVEVIDLASAFEDDGLPELAGVNLQIDAGEIISLVGPVAAENPPLRLIAGVLRPAAGEIKVFGRIKSQVGPV